MKYKLRYHSKKAIKHLWTLFAVLLVIFAILLSVARLLVPVIDHQKARFEKRASEFLNRPITVGKISASFENFEPVIVFKNVTVLYDAQENQSITIPELSVGMDIFHSILDRQLVMGHIAISGLQLNADILPDNTLNLRLNNALITQQPLGKANVVSSSNTKVNKIAILEWLLAQQRLILKNISITFNYDDNKHLYLHHLNTVLVNSGNLHRLRGNAYLGPGFLSKISLGLDVIGQATDIPGIKASLFFNGNNIDLSQLSHEFNYPSVDIESGLANIKVWVDWQNQHVTNVQTNINFSHLQLMIEKLSKIIFINNFKADIVWSNLDNDAWSVALDNMSLNINGISWPDDRLSLLYDPQHNLQALNIKYLDIGAVRDFLVSANILPEDIQKLLININPTGDLQNIELLHAGKFEELQHPSLEQLINSLYIKTGFNNISMTNFEQYPGLRNLSGNFIFEPNGGALNLTANDTVLTMSQVISHALSFNNITANLSWKSTHRGWDAYLTNFQATNKNLTIQSQADLQLDKNFTAPYLSLLMQINENDLSQLKQYLPDRIMHEHLKNWLNEAFIAGKNAQSTIVYRGGLEDISFANSQGVFIADTMFNDLTLNYKTGWPVMSNLDTNLIFRNNKMTVQANDGKILTADIKAVTATIPNLLSTQPVITVQGDMTGDSSAALQFIAHSPLVQRLGKIEMLHLTGNMLMNLKLSIPLYQDGPEESVDGAMELKDNNLSLPSQKLTMTTVNGNLNFTGNSITARNITGQFFGFPATMNIDTLKPKDQPPITRIGILSHIKQQDLMQYFQLPLLNYLQGETDYQAYFSLQDNVPPTLQVNSALEGMLVHLPPPYGKAAEAQVKFSLTSQFLPQDDIQLHINYHDLVDSALILKSQNNQTKLYGGQIVLGSGSATFQDQPGLLITGYLPTFDLAVWKTYFAENNSTGNNNQQNSNIDLIKRVSVQVGKLIAFNQTLDDVRLWLEPKLKAWQMKISSNNIVGTLLYPDDPFQQYIVGNFDKLYLSEPSTTATGVENTPDKIFDPTTVPKIDITAKDFKYNTLQIAGVHFKGYSFAEGTGKGLKAETLELTSKDINLTAQGSWLVNGDKQSTYISGTANVNDLGNVLNQWQVTNKFVSGSGTVNFDLRWPDEPSSFDLSHMKGSAKFNLKNGRIVGLDQSTESKIGLGKIINALSVDSLLHLGDLGKGGYSYSVFSSDMKIGGGKVQSNDAQFSGPVADIAIQGDIDVANKQYDLRLLIVPHLTSSIPIIAGFLVNPLAGAIVWVADKVVISPSLKSVTASAYKMNGPFDDPNIEKVPVEKAGQDDAKK